MRFFLFFYYLLLLILLYFLSVFGQYTPKIAFILATEKEERYTKDKNFFRDEVEKLGGELFYGNSEGSQKKQNELVRKAVYGWGAGVVVIQPVDSFGAKESVDIAKARGVPVIAYDRIIYDADVDYYVSHDSFQVGVIQASEAVKFLGGEGSAVILSGGKNHSVAKQITAGNQLVIDRHPGIKLIGIFYHEGWDEKEGYSTLKKILGEGIVPDAVIANNSSLIRGAIKAIEEAGISKKIFTAGADADLENCRLIAQGRQTIDILKDIEPLARTAARVAFDIARGKKVDFQKTLNNGKVDVKLVLIPVHLVTQDNMRKVIVERKFHPEEKIFGK